jgi:type VI secretion system secreted protein Hcp
MLVIMSNLPRFSPSLALLAPVAAVSLAPTVDAAGFVKYDGIDGESKDPAHDKWIDLASFSWGLKWTPDGTAGESRLVIQGVSMGASANKSSPKLMLACATGQPIEEVTLSLADPNRNEGRDYYKIVLNDVLVTSYQTQLSEDSSASSGADPVPTEEVTLNYSKIEWTYYPADGSEPVVVAFDAAQAGVK